jgi:tRNA(Ile)-lysidine synthase
MGGRLDPAVAAVRVAVRRDLAALAATGAGVPGHGSARVLVACSGGADSTALAAAVAFEAPRLGMSAGALTIDHRLQTGSSERASAVVEMLRALGLDPVLGLAVDVTTAAGPEADARTARYEALDDGLARTGAIAVLLGHTRDDQAETVLLGLARGSGIRSLSGMRPVTGHYRRPLLALDRAVTAAACAAESLPVWTDPHNTDPRFSRARVRHRVLPALERELGPGVAAALARTAELARADADALDDLADAALAALPGAPGGLPVDRLAALVPAIRSRVLRQWLVAAGAPATDLRVEHVIGVTDLVCSWHGQRYAAIPGGLAVTRADGRLHVGPVPTVAG